MSRGMRFGFWLVPLVLFSLAPFALAQYGETGQGMSQDKMGGQAMSVTGCLKQGHEAGGYYLMTKDGKIYELSGKQDFAKHVGHTVTVAGSEAMMSKTDEDKMMEHEKMEADGKPYADLHVTKMKHVSETCGQ